jgi:Transposase, Mutator family
MAFTFGRGKTIGRWLRVRPKAFFDWEKTEGVLPPELCNQHKHEEGTPMLLEPATARNVSRAIKEINAFEWEGDFKPMARQALKQLLEDRLEGEMATYLGVARYEHGQERVDYRNGHYVRHLLTEMGDLELLVPRSRNGGFPTKLFKRYARRCGSIDRVLVFAWDYQLVKRLQSWRRCWRRRSRPQRFRASRGIWTSKSVAITAVRSRINTAIYSSMG